jgi:hypothetical protein
VYNSRRSKRAKDHVLQDYRQGQIEILLTTEAAGMARHSRKQLGLHALICIDLTSKMLKILECKAGISTSQVQEA